MQHRDVEPSRHGRGGLHDGQLHGIEGEEVVGDGLRERAGACLHLPQPGDTHRGHPGCGQFDGQRDAVGLDHRGSHVVDVVRRQPESWRHCPYRIDEELHGRVGDEGVEVDAVVGHSERRQHDPAFATAPNPGSARHEGAHPFVGSQEFREKPAQHRGVLIGVVDHDQGAGRRRRRPRATTFGDHPGDLLADVRWVGQAHQADGANPVAGASADEGDLLCEPGLAHARRAEDGHQAPVGERGQHGIEFCVAPDERRAGGTEHLVVRQARLVGCGVQEQPTFEVDERGPRLEPGLSGQELAVLGERSDRADMVADCIPCAHLQLPVWLVQRLVGDRAVELLDRLRGAMRGDHRPDPHLDDAAPSPVDRGRHGPTVGMIVELGQGSPSHPTDRPSGEVQRDGGGAVLLANRPVDFAAEGVHRQQHVGMKAVRGAVGDDRVAECRADGRHVDVHHGSCRLRHLTGPHVLDEPLDVDGSGRHGGQYCKEATLRWPERDIAAIPADTNRPERADLDCGGRGWTCTGRHAPSVPVGAQPGPVGRGSERCSGRSRTELRRPDARLPAVKRQKVDAWLVGVAPGESLVEYLAGGPANGESLDASDSPGSRHPADLQVQVGLRGLDADRRIAPYSNLCAVLTSRRLLIANLGGAWGARPKDLLQEAPRGGFLCEWWINDVSEAPSAAYFNAVFRFRDGAWAALGCATKLLGRTVAAAADAERFVAALGADGTQIDWRPTGS